MSCDGSVTLPANTKLSVSSDKGRADTLLQFAAWDIENLWQNCRAAGFTDDEIRTAVIDLAERAHRRHQAE